MSPGISVGVLDVATILEALKMKTVLDLATVLPRNYPFSVLPTQARNTFTSNTWTLGPPTAWFKSAGSVAESNKIFEAYVERQQDTGYEQGLEGPGATFVGDFTHVIAWQQQVRARTAANIGAQGWIGVELGSLDSNTQTAFGTTPTTPANGIVQLRQQMKDPSKWEAVVCPGSAGVGEHVQFDVPVVNAGQGVTADQEGHHCMIVHDPFTPQIKIYVDQVLRATLGGLETMTAWPWSTLMVGLVAWSGTQSGACIIDARWTGMTIAALNTGKIGAGI